MDSKPMRTNWYFQCRCFWSFVTCTHWPINAMCLPIMFMEKYSLCKGDIDSIILHSRLSKRSIQKHRYSLVSESPSINWTFQFETLEYPMNWIYINSEKNDFFLKKKSKNDITIWSRSSISIQYTNLKCFSFLHQNNE